MATRLIRLVSIHRPTTLVTQWLTDVFFPYLGFELQQSASGRHPRRVDFYYFQSCWWSNGTSLSHLWARNVWIVDKPPISREKAAFYRFGVQIFSFVLQTTFNAGICHFSFRTNLSPYRICQRGRPTLSPPAFSYRIASCCILMRLLSRVRTPVLSANFLAYTLIAAFQTMPSNSNIRIQGGIFNTYKGSLTVIDRSRRDTNIECFNIYDNKLTEAYNTNSQKNGERFRLILIQSHLMTWSRCSW